MAKGHKPVAGSRAFWPKKRAKRIYNIFKSYKETGEALPLGFAGYKAGMIQVIYTDNRKNSPTNGQEIVEPVTVLECPSLIVCGIKLYKKSISGPKNTTTIWSDKIPKDLDRKTKIPKKSGKNKIADIKEINDYSDARLLVCTKPRESGFGKKKPELFEMQVGGALEEKWNYIKEKLGSEIKPEEVFKEGDWADVKSVTKGKGFQGPVKRFGVTIRGRKNEKKRRHVGNIGSVGAGRVFPGKIAMPGQLGFQTRTEYNKRILKIGTGGITPKGGFLNYGIIKGNYMLIHGSVPGPKKRLIMVRKAIREPNNKDPIEIKSMLLNSQQ
ncbi:MAG: 50S ribosomal protein L3 [Nanoarchaeota archaeon]|nr:50S ribosomal protein L3 [Nanoarchaeota archaeon]MBU1135620.1 50S ribosomal protein L3 [Nanoarchaeota archaeon]